MSIVVYAPASTANVSVGFDVLGGALTPIDGQQLGDCVKISEGSEAFSFDCVGRFAHKLPCDPKKNIVFKTEKNPVYRSQSVFKRIQ